MRSVMLMCLAASLLGACVGGGSDDSSAGRVLLSDGTPAGDLVEAQMRMTAEQAECAADLISPEWFFDAIWPQGRAECLRDALHGHTPGNEKSIHCATESYRTFATCIQQEECVVPEDFQASCDGEFASQLEACPELDDVAQREMQQCYREGE